MEKCELVLRIEPSKITMFIKQRPILVNLYEVPGDEIMLDYLVFHQFM